MLVGFIGFFLLNFLSTAQNVFEIKPKKNIFEGETIQVGTIHELSLQIENIFQSTPLKGEENKQINILIWGEGGKNYPGGNLTDTILIGSISLAETKKVTLFSIPRDLYIKIPKSNACQAIASLREATCPGWTKINAACSYGGVDSLKVIAQDLTGLPIHYYIGLDFEEFIKIIDALGGLPVYVEEDIYDPLFPGPNYSYEPFELSQGWHYLDGLTALKYIRSRYTSQGDFSRTTRQQQILEALRIKLRSPKSFLSFNLVSTILGSLGSGFKTDIKFFEIGRFYTLANEILPESVENKIIDISESGLLTGQNHPTAGSILIPKAGIGNYGEIKKWVEEMIK